MSDGKVRVRLHITGYSPARGIMRVGWMSSPDGDENRFDACEFQMLPEEVEAIASGNYVLEVVDERRQIERYIKWKALEPVVEIECDDETDNT